MRKLLSLILVILFLCTFVIECAAINYNRIETEYFEEYCDEYSGRKVV